MSFTTHAREAFKQVYTDASASTQAYGANTQAPAPAAPSVFNTVIQSGHYASDSQTKKYGTF